MNSTITLTHEELAAVLSLSGYERDIANKMLDWYIFPSQLQPENSVYEPVKTLAAKGYLDSGRPTGLADRLEQMIHFLGQFKPAVRWLEKDRIRFIHPFSQKSFMVQEICNGKHFFSFHGEKITETLNVWYRSQTYALFKDMEFLTLELTQDTFEELYQMTGALTQELIAEKSAPPAFRQFIYDFNQNKKEIYTLSFLNKRNKLEVDQSISFIPGGDCVWYIDFKKAENDQIFITPLKLNDFLSMIELDIQAFMVTPSIAN
ncbi:hypothetical protein [Jeotgalibacillus proteolyticus]|uniref:Uncharacterized protein n=1 Tax=Jeotgalibacillus proteolyticus TaxID=2082395 RepID=A0A2S5GCV8_9BACL|nr:hypothetical protein [Jeotgalibacillus proteolyticus]PPA70751.1 hypothetical protein C4B60_08130 [Jeotgalibacillus proteolyticus]